MLEIYLNIFLVLLTYVFILFIISIILKRNDIVDIAWGPGIFLASLTAYLQSPNQLTFFLLILNFLWSTRIFLHIGSRYLGKKEEDFRYKVWRDTWKYFYLRSFLQIYLLQGFLMFVVALAIINSTIFFTSINYTFLIAGTLVFLLGLYFETRADLELKRFIADKNNAGKILSSGLWSRTRHPNYFGEVTLWWGIFIACIPNVNILSILSPICITYLILYVSGIPMLEKKYEGNKDFEEYKAKTPAFFPKIF